LALNWDKIVAELYEWYQILMANKRRNK
jgi:hypothetical protein